MGQKDRPNYWKNAALLTGSDVVLRLAGLGLRIGLANALGGEGMGLYQLVLAVYGLFVTLATAGISVAAARLLTEELSRDKAAARGMLVRLVLAGLTLGGLAMAAQLATAGLAAKWWLGDVRAAAALRTSALGLPWMAVSAVLRGFFLCGHAGIYAGLVKGKRVEGREHADIWQDRDIVFTMAVTVWRNIHNQGNMEVRSAIYDSFGIFCHAAV